MIPTIDELDVALEAAAERAHHRTADDAEPWHQLAPDDRERYRDLVRPIVEAVLEALPDRAPAARHATRAELVRLVRLRLCACTPTPAPGVRHFDTCPLVALESDELA